MAMEKVSITLCQPTLYLLNIIADLEPQIVEKGGGGTPTSVTADEKNVYSKPSEDMSVCVETSTTALVQPVVSSLSTSTSFSELVVSTSTSQISAGTVTLTADTSSPGEIKADQHLAGKSIAKLVVTTQHGSTSSNQVLQKVVNSPLITVLNSTGPLTVVKSLCVTSVVSSTPHYTLVNSAAPLNVTNTVCKTPTITVLNCGPLASPVTVVKAISAQQALEKATSDIPPVGTSNIQKTIVSPAVIENRGHNVFVKNTCPDSTISDIVPQSHKLLTATNFSPNNVLSNIASTGKPPPANGQRNKLKILSNVQIAGSSQQNVIINKNPNLSQPRYNVTARQKLIGVNNAPPKYLAKSPNNILKPMANPPVKSLQDKVAKLPPGQKGPIKSLPPSSFMPKPQQGIKTLSPQHKNVPGQVQRTGSGLRTIPPQKPQKVATKANYIGKHAVQAQKLKQSTNPKLKAVRPSAANMYGYHSPLMHEKQLTFNQALTAQIIETLSNTSTPLPSNRYEILPAKYDSAFNCPDKQLAESVKTEDKTKSGLDALSLICQAVLLDHNYNATLPSESPSRPTPPIITQAQVNGLPPTSIYSAIQNKRRIVPPPNSLSIASHSNIPLCASNSVSLLANLGVQDDDAASDISEVSDRKHDTEGEETDTAPEAEDVKNDDHYGDYVTRCICGFLHDDGYMVECDKCKVWQHVQCVVKNRQVPDEYLCEVCNPGKPVDRQKARLVQQQWLRERQQIIDPKLRKESKLKESLRNKEHMSDSDSSDGERIVRNNNVVVKNRAASAVGRRKSDNVKVNKKEGKETVQRRQKRKEKRIVKRKAKLQIKPQQSHSDDENQDTWSAHMPQLRQWIEKYEEAVTNHYSPELRARISSIRVNGAHVDSSVNYDATVCKCRIHTQPLTEIKYLVSTGQLTPNTPIIELRGKYMLSTQHRNSGGSLTTRQHTQRPGPFLFFYRLHRDNTEVCVDTRTYGNSARFIRRSCKPNAELRHCIEKGVLHLFIVSVSTVEKNSELTIKHESHDLAAVGTTQIACACGRPDECTVNKTTIKKNGEAPEVVRKRRGRRTMSSSAPSPNIKSPVKEQPPAPIFEPIALPEPPAPEPVPPIVEEPKIKEEKVEVIEPAEVKIEIKDEPVDPLPEKEPEVKVPEIKDEVPEIKEERKSPSPPPLKVEVKKEKPPKEEKVVKSPPPTPIATRRASHHKSDNNKEEIGKEIETKDKPTKSKKLSREERKLEAILRAIEQMEKADQKKQEHQAKQAAHRRESEPGPNPKEEDKIEPKIKRRRRRGRARTTSTNAQTRRSRMNSTDSYMTSGDENMLSPNDITSPIKSSAKETNTDDKAAGLLLALSNGESEGNNDIKKSPAQELDSSSNSAHSSPETPQLSSACLLVQAAVEPLESGFKFPKTKKGLMNEWLNKAPDSVQSASSISPSSLIPHLSPQVVEEATSPVSGSKNLSALAQAANLCDTPSQQQRGGNAKKRWLRQAISEDHSSDSPIGQSDSPPLSDAVAPPKKRKLPRESVSNDNSPPSTPTSSGPAKSIDTPRSSQEGSVEIIYSGAEGDSPSHTMESDAELKERAAKMKQEFGKTVTLSTSEQIANNLSALLDRQVPRENSLFSSSEHLVGTVEKTLSIFGFENAKPQVNLPVKRKVKLSISEYRQRKKLNSDKTDDNDIEHDSQGHDDNNSSESFKMDILLKSRSRTSSSSSSFSSFDELSTSDIMIKAPAFNCEPTELERQREISSIRLKKAFGLAIDDESRKSSVIDMASILQCDLESKIKPSPLTNVSFTSYCELSMSPTLKASATPDRAYTPILPVSTDTPLKTASPTKETEKSDASEEKMPAEHLPAIEAVEPMEVDPSDEKADTKTANVEMNTIRIKGDKDSNMFYTPDDCDEDRVGAGPVVEEPDTVNYVPPFNNPVYPNSNFAAFASTIDDDSRFQSRNPSPPPDLEATAFSAS